MESLVGQLVSAPTSCGCYIEGVVYSHNMTTGLVTLTDNEGENWSGYDYQIESIEE